VILAARSQDALERTRALGAVITAYRPPLCGYVRARWASSPDEAEDLVQGFFANALEKGWLSRFEPERGRFRSYLLTCLERYVAKERRADRRLKRGGGVTVVGLEAVTADGCLSERPIPAAVDLEAQFQRDWARTLFTLALEALRQRCAGSSREVAFALFERYDVEGADDPERPSYGELAVAFGLPVTQVTNHLHWARRELRATVLAKLREITATDEEFRSEARALLGVDPS
jgi:RNA polymerase sigma-70 factor (ECF subfamily)